MLTEEHKAFVIRKQLLKRLEEAEGGLFDLNEEQPEEPSARRPS